jgi:diguanylate cyclase (GGDEF)-like protein/PAS domain S-box-containing protein
MHVTHEELCRLLETALAAVTDAVIATDAAERIVYVNSAAESMTGWRAAESLGNELTQVLFLVDQESDRVIESPLLGIDATRISAPIRNAALVNRQGLQVGIEYSVLARRGVAGEFLGAILMCRPRRHEAEIALRSSTESLLANEDALFEEKERAQVTLNSIGDAVISTNFNGRVHYLNGVAEKMTGWTQGDAAGRAVDDILTLVNVNSRALIACPTAQAIIENRRISLDAVCVLSRRPGDEVAVELSAAPIHDRHGGVAGAVMVAHDVTAARELSSKLARLALHDSLTDLPNRALFTDRLTQAIAHSRAHGCHSALLYVDLDRFKHINDSLGHSIGDQLLQTVARRLLGCVRSSDTVSRQGGDEFVVLLAEIHRVGDAAVCAEKILGALQSPYQFGEHEVRVTASIGIAVFPDDAQEGDALMRCADLAMYQAKYNGRNNYRLFTGNRQLHRIE